ncbi:MAG: hypothetical protein JST39_24400, partial [Bacteroidetes bacterium]|nr:hypothetical protein [Bacteroidota bacterium]
MKQSLRYITALCMLLIAASGCRKYLEVPLPIDSIAGSAAFQNDYSSAGTLNSIYAALYSQSFFDGGNGLGGSINSLSGLYSDELKNFSTLPAVQAVYANGVSSTLGGVTAFWPGLYSQVYSVNLAIEGLTQAKGL